MTKDKRAFMAHLKRIYKEERDPLIKELRNELKKRRMEFYTRADGKKTLVFVQQAVWRRGKSPRGHEWSDSFKVWDDDENDDENDCRETLLVWTEQFGREPRAGVECVKGFVTDDNEDKEDVSYIQ